MIKTIKKLIPSFLIDYYHFFWALLGALVFRFPCKNIKVIGITGTNGKSTTVELIVKILEQAGFKVAALSSIRFKIGNKEEQNELRMTMPGRMTIQKFLRQAVNSKCKYAIIEVTSEGIKQHRHQFINFQTAIFTNLSPEHIESHGSFEKYRQTKTKLFKRVKNIHILNSKDENIKYFSGLKANKKYFYSLNKIITPEKELNISNLRVNDKGIGFRIENIDFELGLLGKFNIENSLAAICLGLSQGIDLETCKNGLKKAKGVVGRMELVVSNPFSVFVDYAFTPNALEKVYQTIKNNWVQGKMICVLGSCGGGRDKWKRPVLGELAAKYCDQVIVTNEDPYDEDPMEIINQVASGTKGKGVKIQDRREAIKEALESAKAGDAVVITGKGSEPSICLANGKKIDWDDTTVVLEEFKKLQ